MNDIGWLGGCRRDDGAQQECRSDNSDHFDLPAQPFDG
jgi:hypothetical protein